MEKTKDLLNLNELSSTIYLHWLLLIFLGNFILCHNDIAVKTKSSVSFLHTPLYRSRKKYPLTWSCPHPHYRRCIDPGGRGCPHPYRRRHHCHHWNHRQTQMIRIHRLIHRPPVWMVDILGVYCRVRPVSALFVAACYRSSVDQTKLVFGTRPLGSGGGIERLHMLALIGATISTGSAERCAPLSPLYKLTWFGQNIISRGFWWAD